MGPARRPIVLRAPFAHGKKTRHIVTNKASRMIDRARRGTESKRQNSGRLRDLRISVGLSQNELADLTGYSVRTIQRWENGSHQPREAAFVCLVRAFDTHTNGAGQPSFTFIDLFAGIGGMRLGFEAAGGKCVFTSEWDKYSQQTYRANFGITEPILGDIRKVPHEAIPDHDVLLAGFPCQPFSLAGVSKKNALGRPHGFADETQGTLFFEIAEILQRRRPAAFLLENVKHLARHDGGRTFSIIMKTLRDDLGYTVQTLVVDARRVLPQHRERIFIAGFREATEFDIKGIERILPKVEEGPTLGSILHKEDGSESPEAPYTEGPHAEVSKKYVLTTHLWQYLRNYARKHQQKGNGFGFGLVGPADVTRTLSARYYKDGSEILIRRNRANPRRLTPRECARLMGFDRAGRDPFKIPVSDTQAYRQFGNAVAVPVVEAFAKLMRPSILRIVSGRPDPQLLLPLRAASGG